MTENKININNMSQYKNILKQLLYVITLNIKNRYNVKYNNNILNNINKVNKNKLANYNNILDYNNNMYYYNTSNLLNTLHKDKIVENYIKQLMSQLINNKLLTIYYSNPIFNHTINKVNVILFIYIPKRINNNMIVNIEKSTINNNNIIIRLINKLIIMNMNKSINTLFTKLYNKNVVIEPLYLTYDYMDSNILSNTISVIHQGKSNKSVYLNMMNKNIPLININNIIYNKINNVKLLNKLLTLKSLSNINTLNVIPGTNTDINNIELDGYMIDDNVIKQLLIYQYIIGYD
jgi:hypothetical protein